MEILGFELNQILIGTLIQLLITIFIGAFLLHLATKILNFKNKSLTKAFIVVITGGIIALIIRIILSSILQLYPILGILLGLIIYWYIIKNIYDVGWSKSILAWLMSIVVSFIITIIILLIIGISIYFFSTI